MVSPACAAASLRAGTPQVRASRASWYAPTQQRVVSFGAGTKVGDGVLDCRGVWAARLREPNGTRTYFFEREAKACAHLGSL